MTQVIAHRGDTSRARENTLDAFLDALAAGADGIELDVQLTGDGVPVVHHDPVLSATPGAAPVAIGTLTLGQVRDIKPVPTLSEAITAVDARCHVFIELKDPAALESVAAVVRGHHEWCALHSFDHRVIARAAIVVPEIPRGILLVSRLVDPVAALGAASAVTLWQHSDMIDADLVDRVHAADCGIIAWTVNDDARARDLLSIGVDGLCTDRLAVMRRIAPR